MEFRAQIAAEKKRLGQQQRELQKRMADIQSQLSDLADEMKAMDRGMAAIQAYENAIADVPASRGRRPPKSDAPPTRRRRRRRRGSRRVDVLSAIASSGSAGVTRKDIIVAFNVKGDRSAEQSISSALAALKKTGAVAHQDGKYVAAPDGPTK